MIREWMTAVNLEPFQCGLISGGGNSFIHKILDGIFAFPQAALSLVMVFNTIHNMIWI